MASENEGSRYRTDSRPHTVIGFLGRGYEALLDTGSTASYINEEVAKWLIESGVQCSISSSRLRLADGSIKETYQSFELTVDILSRTVRHNFAVMNALNGHVLVGDELLKKLGIKLTDEQGNEIGGRGTNSEVMACTSEDQSDPTNFDDESDDRKWHDKPIRNMLCYHKPQ